MNAQLDLLKPDLKGFELPNLMELGPRELPLLQRILFLTKKCDPFMRSAGYFAMTGRNGLWFYGSDQSGMVISRHPNRDHTVLFFPPFGRNSFNLFKMAMSDKRIAPFKKIQIARLSSDDSDFAKNLLDIGYPAHSEDVLDWTYPIHIVSVEKTIERKGLAFNNFRSYLNKANKMGYSAEPLNVSEHKDMIAHILRKWASDGKKENFTYEDLTTPTKSLLDLMESKTLSLNGVLVKSPSEPAGFWIWDEGDKINKTAMSLARVSVGGRGAAEFAGLKMAESLATRGFIHICLGGSETESLDKFKRKFVPINSIELKTVTIR